MKKKMRMKSNGIAYMAVALMAVLLMGCSDDDDPKPSVPQVMVTNLTFRETLDTNNEWIGELSWELPSSMYEVTGYAVYLSDGATSKGEKLGTVSPSATSFVLGKVTTLKSHAHLIAFNDAGESEAWATVATTPVEKENKLFILNGGNYYENDANISVYDLETGTLSTNFYQAANGNKLGDSAEQLLIYGDKIYVTVTNSNRLVVLDRQGKLLKSIEPTADGAPLEPRCMAADDGKLYISYYMGHAVAVMDTASLEVTSTVSVGRYPEQLAIAKGKVYVANSGGRDYPNYGNTLSVINQSSLAVEKVIDVALNPVALSADSDGDIYLLALADYGETTPSCLQRIDGTTGAVTTLGNASKMALVNDKIFVFVNMYFIPGIFYQVYDAKTEKLLTENFITDGTTLEPYGIAVHPVTEQIFISQWSWGSNGALCLFSKEGKLEKRIEDTGGADPKWMTVLY